MTKKIECDICGNVTEEPINFVSGLGELVIDFTIAYEGYSDHHYRHEVDICQECKSEVTRFIYKWFREKRKET